MVFVLLVVAVGVYLVWSSREARRRVEARQLAEATERHRLESAEARASLARWGTREWQGSQMLITWEIDFASMVLRWELQSSSGPGFTTSHVRRLSATQWEVKETDDSRRANIAQADRERAAMTSDDEREAHDEMNAPLRSPPVWLPYHPERHVAGIETAYQRFIHAGPV